MAEEDHWKPDQGRTSPMPTTYTSTAPTSWHYEKPPVVTPVTPPAEEVVPDTIRVSVDKLGSDEFCRYLAANLSEDTWREIRSECERKCVTKSS